MIAEVRYPVLDPAHSERFWAKINFEGPFPDTSDELVTAPATRCWEWTAAKNALGYGKFGTPPGVTEMPHRLTYMQIKGEIPEGLVIDHLCRYPSCVNPDHLRAVTQQENTLAGASLSSKRSRYTHCPQGHEYTESNTYVSPRNQRHCLTCRGKYARESRERLRGVIPSHGSTTSYNKGCRCRDCKQAMSDVRRLKRERDLNG